MRNNEKKNKHMTLDDRIMLLQNERKYDII